MALRARYGMGTTVERVATNESDSTTHSPGDSSGQPGPTSGSPDAVRALDLSRLPSAAALEVAFEELAAGETEGQSLFGKLNLEVARSASDDDVGADVAALAELVAARVRLDAGWGRQIVVDTAGYEERGPWWREQLSFLSTCVGDLVEAETHLGERVVVLPADWPASGRDAERLLSELRRSVNGSRARGLRKYVSDLSVDGVFPCSESDVVAVEWATRHRFAGWRVAWWRTGELMAWLDEMGAPGYPSELDSAALRDLLIEPIEAAVLWLDARPERLRLRKWFAGGRSLDSQEELEAALEQLERGWALRPVWRRERALSVLADTLRRSEAGRPLAGALDARSVSGWSEAVAALEADNSNE